MSTTKKLWIGIIILALLSPLGLILPEYFKAQDAWGEWSAETIQEMTGYIPHGLAKLSSLWNAPVPDYAFRGWEEKGPGCLGFAYIFSAACGIAVTVALVLFIGKILTKKGGKA